MSDRPAPSRNRMNADVLKLMKGKHEVELLDGFKEFHVKFHGPAGSLYEGGVWKVRVHLPDKYPFKSPSLGFVNIIYHPNVDEPSGSICLNVLNEVWSALYDLSHIFEIFLPVLLTDPNPQDALNQGAAKLYMDSPEQYRLRVKQYVRQYASKEILLAPANPALKMTPDESGEASDSESSMSSCSDDDQEM